ncbi:MAG: SpaA isopeptide-forming pilin-related protein [Acutalibacteraceae bacterium]|nr:SpaA isopeptide-forming pilin-related protein [Acutalibacteraceae bacterium]
MCKKFLSVVLVAMMLCTLFAPVGSAYYQEGFETITDKDTISKKWYRYAAFWNEDGDGGGVSAHYVDKNKNGKPNRAEFLICLQRTVPSGSGVSDRWEGADKIADTDVWGNIGKQFGSAEAPIQKNAVVRTLLNGYPNNDSALGVKTKGGKNDSVTGYEKFYATQILVWEFVDGVRKYDNLKASSYGPVVNTKYNYHKAFLVDRDTNYNDTFIGMTIGTKTIDGKKVEVFIDAYNYYCALLEKVDSHTKSPKVTDIKFSGDNKLTGANVVFDGKGTYTAKHSMFSDFTFKSSDTNVATVSQDGDTLTIKIKKIDAVATITGTKKNSESNYDNPNGKLTPAVMIQSGAGNQVLMWGTGSLIDPVSFAFRVSAEQKYGGIGVLKVNTENLPLSGVKFGVYGSEANAENKKSKLATITTNDEGKAHYGGTTEANFSLEEGKTYYLRELSTQSGYKLEDEVYPVTVVAGTTTYVDVMNRPAEEFGAIGIVKIDESKNSVVYNPTLDFLLGHKTSATFGLYADEACEILIDKGTTQANGSNVLLGVDENGNFTLEAGRDYYIKELSAPYGLTPSDVVESVRVRKNKVEYVNWEVGASQGDLVEYEVNNSLGSNHDYTNAGGFKIIPVSNRSDVKSVSVVLSYNRGTDDTPTYTVDAALDETVPFYGIAKSSGNAIKLPENSILVAGKHDVVISVIWTYKDGSTNAKVVSYPAVANRVVVHTIDDESGWINYSYAGIKAYKYYKVHDKSVQPIEGVTFGVYESFEDAKSGTAYRGNEIKKITTDENGEAYILYAGESGLIHPYSDENPYMYYLKELSAPEDCIVTDEIYPVIVGCVDGTFVMNKSDGTIEYVSDEVYNDSFADDRNYIKVQESVTTRGGLTGMMDILFGVNNLVEDETAFATVLVENEIAPTIKITKHCETGADGFKFKIVNVYGETLKTYNGKYFFIDYPSEEYVPSSSYKDVVLTTVADESDNTVAYATLEGITLSQLFEEYVYWGYDSEYAVVPRKLFLVEDMSSASGFKSVNTQVYDEDGTTIKHCGLIDFEKALNHEFEITNVPITGKLVIEKQVDVGSAEGWMFRVEGTYLDGSEYNEVHTTGADGKAEVTGLCNGTVTVTELAEQDIDGYYCDGDYSQTIILNWKSESEVKTVRYSNIQRVFKIFKKDMYDCPLAGVEFTVYGTMEEAEAGDEGFLVLTTDENGWAYFEGFGADVYFIRETKTLDGYQLSPEIYVLNNSMNEWKNTGDDVANWKVVNYLKVDVPTGINNLGSVLSLLALPVALVTGTVGYNFYKKRKRKNLI